MSLIYIYIYYIHLFRYRHKNTYYTMYIPPRITVGGFGPARAAGPPERVRTALSTDQGGQSRLDWRSDWLLRPTKSLQHLSKTPPRPPEVTKTGPEGRFLSILGRFGVLREIDFGALAMLFRSSGSIRSQKGRTSFRLGMGESKCSSRLARTSEKSIKIALENAS